MQQEKTNYDLFGIGLSDLQPGDWIKWRWSRYYVQKNSGRHIQIGDPDWSVTSNTTISYADMSDQYYPVKYLGRGKLKWYWRFLPWRNSICPFNLPQEVK